MCPIAETSRDQMQGKCQKSKLVSYLDIDCNSTLSLGDAIDPDDQIDLYRDRIAF